jgi:glycerol-3-phosphate dehydrogenase subunit C
VKKVSPEKIVTDCLSCRLQFTRLLPYDVIHLIEILKESYGAYSNRKKPAHAGA